MNYHRIYDELILNALNRSEVSGYTERHHIVMKSMGGTDDPDNLVILTAREHYIAHWLLHKIHRNKYTGGAWASMTSNKSGNRYVSRTWSIAREAGINAHKGSKRSPETCRRISEAALGRKASKETRDKMSARMKGEGNYFYGKTHSYESRKKIRESRLGKYGKPVLAIDMVTGEEFTFPSANYAANEDHRDIGRDSSSIRKACIGKYRSHNGYFWKYAGEA